MMPKQQARAAVEAELFALELKKPLSLPEKSAFCESACHRLVFQSETDRLKEIIEWTDAWQELWLPDNRPPSTGTADDAVGEPLFKLLPLDWARLASRVAAWRAEVGRVFAKHRSPQNEKQFGDKGVWTPRATSAP
jgi:hypothetical protein